MKSGIKLWGFASLKGYPFNLQVYVGKKKNPENNMPLDQKLF